MPRLGIIGGSGVYGVFEPKETVKVHTPYGNPSDKPLVGKFAGREVVFISRHGPGHIFNPTNVNYRANIWAMKELGVTHILAPCAVGSLKEDIEPGDILFPDQFVDFTKRREYTFFTGQKV